MADLTSLVTRRSMIATMATGAAAAGTYAVHNSTGFSAISADSFFSKPKVATKAVKLATAEFADWRAQVGTLFTLETGHVLKLGSVATFADSDGPAPGTLRKKAFVARFNVLPPSSGTPPPPPAADRIYRVSHPTGGTFSIFLSIGDIAKPDQRLAVYG